MAPNRKVIPLVQGLRKTVDTRLFLDSILPESKDYYPLPEGARPLFSISYEDIDLNGIEKVYQIAKDKVLPLKNFFWRKQKEQDDNKSNGVLSFYGVTNENKLSYGVAVEPTLIEKLQLALKSPELSVKMWITCLNSTYVFYLCFNGIAKFRLVNTTITKQAMEDARVSQEDHRVIDFDLTVKIECEGADTTRMAPKIDSAKFFCKVFKLPDPSKDVTIVASNKSEIKAHKNILIAHSPTFLSMFSKETDMTEAKSGKILMEQNSAEGIAMFVRCLYGFELPIATISPDLVLEVFQLSHLYWVSELEMGMRKFLMFKDVNWYTVDSLLELYFFVKNLPSFEDLADHALIEMSKLATQSMVSSDYFKKLEPADARDLVIELWDRSK